jgi:hypothetical protein
MTRIYPSGHAHATRFLFFASTAAVSTLALHRIVPQINVTMCLRFAFSRFRFRGSSVDLASSARLLCRDEGRRWRCARLRCWRWPSAATPLPHRHHRNARTWSSTPTVRHARHAPITASPAPPRARCGARSEFLSVTCAARRPDAGNDLGAGVYAASAGGCCSRCESIAACQYYTFNACQYYTFNAVATCPGGKRKGCCHAKTSKAGSTPSHGAVSGKSGSFTPPPPPPPAPPGVKNVLVMIADDLRPQLIGATARDGYGRAARADRGPPAGEETAHARRESHD